MKLEQLAESNKFIDSIYKINCKLNSIEEVEELKGIDTVNGDLRLSYNNIKNLDCSPNVVHGVFDISDNPITSLKGSPKKVATYSASNIDITDLEGCSPEISQRLILNNCKKLKSLKGAPKELHDITVTGSHISSFEGAPERIEYSANFSKNPELKSLVGIHKHLKFIGNSISFIGCDIEEGGLGLLLIKGLRYFHHDDKGDFGKALGIITNYLGKGRSALIQCQEELEDAGLEQYAKL